MAGVPDGLLEGVEEQGVQVSVKGQVDLGKADMMGTGDRNAVNAVVRRYKGQVKYCYDKRLKTDPNLAGRVEIEFSIGRGRVLTANVASNTTRDSALASCIVRKVKAWTFPPRAEMDVIYPFVLSR